VVEVSSSASSCAGGSTVAGMLAADEHLRALPLEGIRAMRRGWCPN
jgi:hypothetical protein